MAHNVMKNQVVVANSLFSLISFHIILRFIGFLPN